MMANSLFEKGREAFLCGQIKWLEDKICAVLCDGKQRKANIQKDRFLADLGAAVVSKSVVLTGKTGENGVACANSVVIEAVDAASVDFIVVYQDTGSRATSRLIAHIDTLGSGKFPFSPQAGDVHIGWESGKTIFRL
jgi:hypothetical protein